MANANMNNPYPNQNGQNMNRPVQPMKQCKHCRQMIDARAKVCPYCRKKQSSSGCLVLLLVGGGIIALLVLLFIFIAVKLSDINDAVVEKSGDLRR